MKNRHTGKIKDQGRPSRWKTTAALGLTLAALTAIAYEPVRHNGFVDYDDTYYLTENYRVQDGLSLGGAAWAFRTSACSNWHPLTWLSHMLDCELFGMNAAWHHGVSVLLHAVSCVLLMMVLYRMTGSAGLSFFVAGSFALHPVHVESVAWASERKDVLSGLFFVLTLAAYVWYGRRPRVFQYVIVTLMFAMGLLAKPMLVSVPLVLLLLDYWPLRRWRRDGAGGKNPRHEAGCFRDGALREFECSHFSWQFLVVEKIPLLLMSAASSIVTYKVQEQGGAMEQGDTYPLGIRLGNAVISYFKYLGKLAYPSNLAPLYPHPESAVGVWGPVVAIVGLIMVTALLVYAGRRRGYLLTGWLWYVVMLIPVIGIVQVGLQGMADRYLYLPSIGIIMAASWGVWEYARGRRWARFFVLAVGAGILIWWTAATRAQVGYWRDSLTLFSRAVSVTEKNYICYNNYAQALLNAQALPSDVRLEKAIEQLNHALEAKSDYVGAMVNLGAIYKVRGELDLAEQYYQRAIARNENYYPVLNNLAWLRATSRNERYRDASAAIRLAQHALELAERSGDTGLSRQAEILDTLAAAYAAGGQFDRAVDVCQESISLARKNRQNNLLSAFQKRLALYQQGKAFYE